MKSVEPHIVTRHIGVWNRFVVATGIILDLSNISPDILYLYSGT